MSVLEITRQRERPQSPLVPNPIAIEVPVLDSSIHDSPGQMMTCLFPKYASLPESQELLCDRAEDKSDMNVFSAGCSNGAVAYSLAGLHYSRRSGGHVKYVGQDKSFHAAKVALAGKHNLPFKNYVSLDPESGLPFIDIGEDVQVLREFGFEVDDVAPYRDEKQVLFGGHGFKVNVRPLERDNHFVFGEADLLKEVPKRRRHSADLVQATGLIDRFDPETALQFARNMGRIAKFDGAIVFGEVPNPYLQNMGGPLAQDSRGKQTISYAHWMVEKLTRIYKRELGMEPVAFDSANNEIPVAFARI